MALIDKNIVITPNKGAVNDPSIVFSGASAASGAQNVTVKILPDNNGTLTVEGTSGTILTLDKLSLNVNGIVESDGLKFPDGSMLSSAAASALGSGIQKSKKTTSFVAANNNLYLCDTSTSGFNCTLPTGVEGLYVEVWDYDGTWGTNNLTVIPASGDKINGLTENLIGDVSNIRIALTYCDTTKGWQVDIGGILGTNANEAFKTYYDNVSSTMTNKTLVAPALGTPASGTLTNCNGLPAAGVVGTAVVLSAANQTITGNIAVTGSVVVTGEFRAQSSIINTQSTTGITTAKAIMAIKTGDYSGLCLVNGIDSTASHAFFDLVVCTSTFDAAAVVSSSTLYGTPAARTYSFVGDDLKLAMASGTYGTNVTVIETPRVY